MRDYIRERTQKMRVMFRTGDEGAKTLAQMIGQETIDLLLTCNF
jgi:predicted RecB family endonuclease